jgi:secreted trypsin-like serine protease
MPVSKSLLFMAVATIIGFAVPLASAEAQAPSGVNGTPQRAPVNAGASETRKNKLTLQQLTGQQPASRGIVRPLVVGGGDAPDGVHPFQVALVERHADADLNDNYKDHFCGGSLVAERFVVTAAHCLADVTDPSLQVQVLARARKLDGSGERVDIKRVYIHPGYWTGIGADYDVAVLELAKPVTGINFARIAKVPPSRPGERLRVTGWGALGENYKSGYPVNLQQVDVPFVPTEYGLCGDVSPVTPRMFCAGGTGTDSCYGDSGGPLTIDRGAGYTELVGVVSWGKVCGGENSPGVYANLADFSINAFIRNAVAGWTRTIQFEGSVVVLEGSRRATLTVTRSSAEGVATVQYSAYDYDALENADYNRTYGTLTFQPGVSKATISIPVVNDSRKEAPESFAVELYDLSSGWSLANNGEAMVFITDDD